MLRQLTIALLLSVACQTQAADKTLDRTFAVSPGGSLVIEADGASIRVSGADTDKVTVRMRASGREHDLADIAMEAAQQGNEVRATMRRTRKRGWLNWNSWKGDASIEVTTPRRFEVNARTSGGNIELTNTAGAVRLDTSGGDVTARNLDGTIRLRTSGGQITAENVRGDLDANTSGGDVRLLNIDGRIKGNTSGGTVRVSLAGPNRGITATTSGGDVEVSLPPGTTGDISASTSGGSVTTDVPVATTTVKEGRLEGTLNGGGQRIEARTSGGNIRLRQSN